MTELNEETLLSAWDSVGKKDTTVSLEQMNELVIKLRAARDEYDEKKKIATEAYNALEEIEKLVINTLQAAKMNKYEVAGVALVSVLHKESYTTPKTNDDKNKLFTYIKEKYGPDALMSMVNINSQTLNAWAQRESDSGVMQIPGLAAPTATETLSLRRK